MNENDDQLPTFGGYAIVSRRNSTQSKLYIEYLQKAHGDYLKQTRSYEELPDKGSSRPFEMPLALLESKGSSPIDGSFHSPRKGGSVAHPPPGFLVSKHTPSQIIT